VGEITIGALETAYRQRYRRFLRVATALPGDEESAHDAVQEAFARAIRGRFSFRGHSSVDTWLWRTLVNVCTDARGSEGRPRRPTLVLTHHKPGCRRVTLLQRSP
jgi:DNA-directed RNA polymerase specialized sigma24 family protein